jgi:hypothetical protein
MRSETGVVDRRLPFINSQTYMAKAFGGALSLVLTLLVLRLALPGVGSLLADIITKVLLIISKLVDQAGNIPSLQ